MSATSGTQIAKPSIEQAFEDNCVVLWKCILKDPSVQKVGRRGQKQKGVDLYGYRDRKRDHLVGLQCKLKTGNKKLTEKEVREEFGQALGFEPLPKEYFILTTADDDQALQALARKLTAEQAKLGLDIVCYVWGWGTICDEASKHAEALDAFDPTYGSHAKLLLEKEAEQTRLIMDVGQQQDRHYSSIDNKLSSVLAAVSIYQPGGSTVGLSDVEAHLDREIDGYRELANGGKAESALSLFEQLLEKVKLEASGRIVFRIKANIGNCLIKLGKVDRASEMLLEAYDHAPEEPKAIINKAFGLLLKKDWNAVLEMGRDNLVSRLADENLSSHVIQAAKFVVGINDPLSLVPEEHRQTAAVMVAYVDFLRGRHVTPAWRELAYDAVTQFPDQEYLQQFAAEATLDEATQDVEFQKNGVLKDITRSKVSAAIVTLSNIWEKARASEGQPDEEAISVLSNLLSALRLVGDLQEAVEKVKEGIATGTSDPEFYLRAAVVAMESRSKELDIDDLVSRVGDTPEKKMLQGQLLLARGDWNGLSSYEKSDVDALPETERSPFAIAVELAKITVGPSEKIGEGLRRLVDNTPADVRCSTIIADVCLQLGHDEFADEAYENARRLIDDDTHYSGRHMLASHAIRRERWSDAADLLLGYVDLSVDSRDLRELATALVNERPVRQRAVNFFKELPNKIRHLPKYRHSEGFLHYYRGDLKLAEARLRDALPENRVDDFLLLLSVLKQRGKETEVEERLLSVSLSKLNGDPAYQMAVAQELLLVGRSDEALEYGYQLAREQRDIPDVMLKYTGLMFRAFDLGLIPFPTAVAENTSFRLEASDGKSLWLTIEGTEDRITDGIISPRNLFAANAIGHPVDFEFTLNHGFGKQQEWVIKEIKHKYLSFLHDIMNNFEDRFPGVNGISSFSLKENDIEPVLAQVKKSAESSKRFAELYTDKRTPLAFVAAHLHQDPVSFAGYVRSIGYDILSCVGQHAERIEALQNIDQHRAAGAVLDSYSAWTCACLGVFDALKAVFGQLVIPRSVLNDLKELLGGEEYVERQSMTMAWRDGEFYKHVHTRDEFEARRDFIRQKIEIIEEHCEVVPVDAPDAVDDLAVKLATMFGPDPLNPAAIAGNGYLLLCEDYHYRQWAKQLWSAKGSWLQPALEYGLHMGVVTLDQYASWLAQLAEQRHGFVYQTGETIFALMGNGVDTDWARISAALHYIGTKDADLISHAETIITFVDVALRNGEAKSLHFDRVFSMLLQNLIRGRSEGWHELIWYVYRSMPPRLKAYVRGWLRGHFLDMRLVLYIESKFLEGTADIAVAKILHRKTVDAPNVSASRASYNADLPKHDVPWLTSAIR